MVVVIEIPKKFAEVLLEVFVEWLEKHRDYIHLPSEREQLKYIAMKYLVEYLKEVLKEK